MEDVSPPQKVSGIRYFGHDCHQNFRRRHIKIKRQRTAALQNLAEILWLQNLAIASWSAAVLCRFYLKSRKPYDTFIARQPSPPLTSAFRILIPAPFYASAYKNLARRLQLFWTWVEGKL